MKTRTGTARTTLFVQSDLEIAVSLGKNDLRIYQKVAGKWKLIHTLTEHLSRVLAIDWAPKTNQIVSASAVRTPSLGKDLVLSDLFRTTMPMSGRLTKTSGNHKWSNCNEPIGRCAARNGLRKVGDFFAELVETMHSFVDLLLENKFAIGSSDKNVAICYYEKDQRFWAAEMIKKKPKSTVTCIAWHPNNQLLAVGSCDYRCRLDRNLRGLFSSILFFQNLFGLYQCCRRATANIGVGKHHGKMRSSA